jgi:hypothetical protein
VNVFGNIALAGMFLVAPNNSTTLFSTIDNANVLAEKIIIVGSSALSIQNSNFVTTWELCLYKSIDIISVSSNITDMLVTGDTDALSILNVSLFLDANNTLSISSSNLTTVSLVVIANDIAVNSSNLNTTAQSCRANTGLGRGSIIQYNGTYCTSGSSSCGFGELSNSTFCA